MNDSQHQSAQLLTLLRDWGWEKGIEKLRATVGTHSDGNSAVQQMFLGWQAAERGDFELAESSLQIVTEDKDLQGWAHLVLAFVAMRGRQVTKSLDHLQEAECYAESDAALLGNVRLIQASTRFHHGDHEGVLEQLEEALTLLGPEGFSRGRVLDALGMWYANKGNVQAAIEFYQQSLVHKRRFFDDSGLAVTYGQLGRVYLDWGQFKLAEINFREDLEVCRRINDRRGEAQIYNFLGVVSLSRDELDNAAAYLDHAIASAQEGGWTVLQGYARKDRAICAIRNEDWDEGWKQIDVAQKLFQEAGFEEGTAHADRVRGILLRHEQNWYESAICLRRSYRYFERVRYMTEVAKTALEVAKTLKAQGVPLPVVRDEFLQALACAEATRRPHLVQAADRELANVDPQAASRQIYRRIRGKRIDEDSTSLMSAEQDIVSVFFFDLQGFTSWSQQTDPSVVMLNLNQMMAAFLESTSEEDVQVIEYMGDGFLAMSRGPHHAHRAVRAAIKLHAALDSFNRPRRVLGQSEFACRIGISTGEVVLGNVGTYEKVDFRAIGTTVNLAARIQNEAIQKHICLSRATWEVVQHDFKASPESPRIVTLKGLGQVQVWDAIV